MTTLIVTGTYQDAESVAQNGTVSFTPTLAGATDAAYVIGDTVVARVVNGVLSQVLVDTDSWAQVSGQVSYRVVERLGTTGRSLFYVMLPASLAPTVDIGDLARYAVPPDVVIDPSANDVILQANITAEAAARAAADSAEAATRAAADTSHVATLATHETRLDNNGWINVKDSPYNATGDGSTNDTTAINAAIAACPKGGTVYFPTGYYKFSTLTPPTKAVHLRGDGHNIHGQPVYGDAAFATLSNNMIFGTVLVSTATSGYAIKFTANNASRHSSVSDMAIVGPGSGSSTGLAFGIVADASQLIRASIRNVSIANFSVGFRGGCENSDLHALYIFACDTGFLTEQAFNGNTITALNIEKCVTYALHMTGVGGDSVNNLFAGGVIQGNSGANVVTLESSHGNTFIGLYMENTTATREVDLLSTGTGTTYNAFEGCHLNVNDADVRIQGDRNRWVGNHYSPHLNISGDYNYVLAPFLLVVAVSGDFNWIQGAYAVTDTGVENVVIDPYNNQLKWKYPVWKAYTPVLSGTGWALGNGTATGLYVQMGETVHYRVSITFGSTSTFGAGQPTFSLPVTGRSGEPRIGRVRAYVAGGQYLLNSNYATSTTDVLWVNGVNGLQAAASATVPATWANGDAFNALGTYSTPATNPTT